MIANVSLGGFYRNTEKTYEEPNMFIPATVRFEYEDSTDGMVAIAVPESTKPILIGIRDLQRLINGFIAMDERGLHERKESEALKETN